MRYRRIIFYRGIIYFMVILCSAGSVICSRQSLLKAEIEMTVLDAVLIYAMSGLKRMAFPLLIAYTNMHRFKYDFKYSYLIRSKSRLSIWYKQAINVVADCIVAAALMMISGTVAGYIVCDEAVDFCSTASVCLDEFRKQGMGVPMDMNIPLMIIETYIISVGELIARTLAAFLIYWLSGSRVISVIGIYVMSYLSLGCMGIRGIALLGTPGALNIRYYSGLYFPSQVLETLMLLAVTIILVLLTAQIFVPLKEFIKE